MGTSRSLAVVLVTLTLAVGSVACSKSSSTTGPSTSGAPAIEERGLKFSPSELSVTSGQVITITNVKTGVDAPHSFTIDGHGIDVTTAPGQTSQVTISLPPGTYPFICKFHVAEGMMGTLTVT